MALSGSDAARFQAYQTRAKMGAALWTSIVKAILSAWVALTIWLIWYRVGLCRPQLQHEYFGRWILCGILTDTPLLNRLTQHLTIPLAGNWYYVPDLAQWLNGPRIYGDSFYSWYWHMSTGLGGYYGIGTNLFPLGICALLIGWRLRRGSNGSDHIRGLRLLPPRQHNRQLNGGIIKKMFNQHTGIKLGESIIPREKEYEHFLITGSPGAGKSTLMRQMKRQVRDRCQSAIVLDVDAEFIQEFYDEARGDVVLNPLDARCPFWSPFLEFRPESFAMDAEAMASSLVRGQPRNPTEQFFRDSARTLIEAIFEKVTDHRHSDSIANFLALPRPELHQALTGTRAYPLVDEHAAEQGTGIVSVAANATKGFYYLPQRKQTDRTWSARQWAQERRGWIFLPSTEDARAAIQALQGVWLDALTRWLMAADIGSDQTWIFADELPAMGYQNQIEQLITRGRKRGLSVVIGFQNVSQLRSIYGRDGATTLTSAPTTKVILRCDEAETAKWGSELLGSREIERTEMTMLAGLSNMREGVNLQARRSSEHIVTPAEIQLLKPFHGYLCVAGNDRTTIRVPERHLEKNFPAFVPRSKNQS